MIPNQRSPQQQRPALLLFLFPVHLLAYVFAFVVAVFWAMVWARRLERLLLSSYGLDSVWLSDHFSRISSCTEYTESFDRHCGFVCGVSAHQIEWNFFYTSRNRICRVYSCRELLDERVNVKFYCRLWDICDNCACVCESFLHDIPHHASIYNFKIIIF